MRSSRCEPPRPVSRHQGASVLTWRCRPTPSSLLPQGRARFRDALHQHVPRDGLGGGAVARSDTRERKFLVGTGSRCTARRLKHTAAPALSSCALLAPQACAPADTGRCHLRTLCLPRNGGGPGRQTPCGSFTQTRDGVSIDQSAVRVARAYGCSLLYGYSCGRTGSDASNTAAALPFRPFRALR